jgi:hypothetical protein
MLLSASFLICHWATRRFKAHHHQPSESTNALYSITLSGCKQHRSETNNQKPPASQPASYKAEAVKSARWQRSSSRSLGISIPYNNPPICATPKRNDATNSISPSSRQEHCFYNT